MSFFFKKEILQKLPPIWHFKTPFPSRNFIQVTKAATLHDLPTLPIILLLPQALKEAAEERRRDREETRLARERVRQQIEQDRAERAAKFSRQKEEEQQKRDDRERQRAAEQAKAAENRTAEMQ